MGRTQCDCKRLSFVALRSYAQRHGITDVEELIRQTGCCTGCGTCRVHLEAFLKTGKLDLGTGNVFKLPPVEWPPLPEEEDGGQQP